MRARLLAMLQRRTRPPLVLGIVVAAVCIVMETWVSGYLKLVTPVHSLDAVYLIGIVVVSSIWGLWLGIATAVASTLGFDYFLTPPLWRLSPMVGEDWAVLAIYIAIAVLASSISKLARSLAVEADARTESDLAAELARLMLRAPDVRTALPAAAAQLARTFELPSAAIELGTVHDDDPRTALALRDDGRPLGALLVPADLPRATLRCLWDRAVPSLQVLLRAAQERESVGDALKASSVELRRVADEQAALRRLATLVAYGVPPAEIFGAVAREMGQILGARHATVLRYENDGTATTVGNWNERGRVATMPLGSRWPIEKGSASELVSRTRAPGRVGGYEGTGELMTSLRKLGVTSSVACPITVGRRLWGVAIASSTTSEPLPEGTEEHMLAFAELVAAAIANAESHAELMASRARVVAAADATRRLIERDLHDGTAQRLVSVQLELRALEQAVPCTPAEMKERLSHAAGALENAITGLREISRGLHPAILSRGGLEPALFALARRCPLPVELNVGAGRCLGERFEVTVYHVVAEALTNAARHARASRVHVDLLVKDASIRLTVRDDGAGGADPGGGSGLTSVRDRVEALGGSIAIVSPPGGGTSVLVEIPVDDAGNA
jgi:signal transduction histidine kinase